MEKEALLSIILHDLKEVEVLVQTFSGKPQILPPFIKLAIQKVENIKQELELLDALPAKIGVHDHLQVSSQVAVERSPVQETVVSKEPETIRIPKPAQAPTQDHVSELLPDKAVERNVVETLDIEPEPQSVTEPVKPEPVQIAQSKTVEAKTETVEPQAIVASPEPSKPPKHEVAIEPESIKKTDAQEYPQHHASHAHKHTATLGETLVTDKSSILDKIHAASDASNSALMGKPIDDIKKAIGINDRFLFQRELFSNNTGLMNQTIDELNRMSSFADAQSFIRSNFDWDYGDATTESFINLVRRRFK